jgi:hypothetical protein
MRLKAAATFFLILGIAMLVAWPWIVGAQPDVKESGRRALEEYVVRFGIYIIAVLFVWFVTAVLAIMVARQARNAYREEAMLNFQQLMEETLKDHGKRNAEP